MEIIINKLNELEKAINKQAISSKVFLTIEEASEYLQLSKSCLYKMTSKKQINYYTPGGKKVYFKREDLVEWITKSINASVGESQLNTESYLVAHH